MTRHNLQNSHIVQVCRDLHARNFLAACDGNVSVRLDEDRILITPSGVHKGKLRESDIAMISSRDEVIAGTPSSERLLHLEIYRSCYDARAIVHAHPPHAIAWSIAESEMSELPVGCMPEVILGIGAIPIVPYARPGTANLAEQVAKVATRNRALIMARHGAVTWGESLDEAYNAMERLEHAAYILAIAQGLGRLSELKAEEIKELKKMRAENGNRSL